MNWIRDQLESRHISQATLAEAVGLTAVQMNKVLSGYRVLQSTEADAIRRYFGYDLPEDVAQPVAIAGRISAGDGLMLVDDHERGGGLSMCSGQRGHRNAASSARKLSAPLRSHGR